MDDQYCNGWTAAIRDVAREKRRDIERKPAEFQRGYRDALQYIRAASFIAVVAPQKARTT